MGMQKRRIMKKRPFLIIFIITLLLNLAAVIIDGFADWYTAHVFPLWVNTLGRFTSLFPFSVGEFMIIAGVLWLVMLLGCGLLLLVNWLTGLKHEHHTSSALVRFSKGFSKATIRLLVIIFLIMTLNCFINYRTTPIIEEEGSGREYTVAELSELRDYIVEKCNELSTKVSRNESGQIIYTDSEIETTEKIDAFMEEEAKKAMSALSERFPKLEGFYVTPKAMLFSEFVSQQNMQGYFFPFSMEANYNDIMFDMNKPFTMCHEMAHTKSYIMEDEANFLAYLACTGSDNIIFEYSGYLGVLNYVNNAFYINVTKEEYVSHVTISDQAWDDNVFLTDEAWDKVESSAVVSTETVKKAADTFVDTTLKVNGINDGIASYNRVVELILMDYYEK